MGGSNTRALLIESSLSLDDFEVSILHFLSTLSIDATPKWPDPVSTSAIAMRMGIVGIAIYACADNKHRRTCKAAKIAGV